ncbi:MULTISPECIES: TetR/AcrR family transcriptional regulator [Arthrobacter]|uniref:TetR/AcrR family transcriptional regulator n=1 Tax=Arthrobacter psychrochitiniphilus TaxID=291045 RepID=A0A2V3DUU8_9MICC|nr:MULTISPECIES: TetR/AcrR family transcriptional regulator [Arthrobacter]NYG16758.1 AcrR family transcriptional regulator [Arthrobacter psychrochitiniphilus]PXA69146.1 TetR/AcrR family transcriptional regulator [Arthrobacter psychrochitiniphilus]
MPRISPTKKAILAAALELGALHGISGTTMDEVAESAGVAKGSVYYNFSSKDKLFEELLTTGVASLSQTLRTAREQAAGFAAIEAMVSDMLALIAQNRALAKLMAAEIFRTDRVWQNAVSVLRREAVSEFGAALLPLVPAGTSESSRLLMAGGIFGATLMGGLEWLLFSPDTPVAEVSAAILFIFSGKLAADAPNP